MLEVVDHLTSVYPTQYKFGSTLNSLIKPIYLPAIIAVGYLPIILRLIYYQLSPVIIQDKTEDMKVSTGRLFLAYPASSETLACCKCNLHEKKEK
uniref:Uncharacterized protein n=1 Tax=Romanomermis culicivorax TaxID=13658 RepID=A0A915JU81_ROMCU